MCVNAYRQTSKRYMVAAAGYDGRRKSKWIYSREKKRLNLRCCSELWTRFDINGYGVDLRPPWSRTRALAGSSLGVNKWFSTFVVGPTL